MRCALVIWLLAGCGRVDFDTTVDAAVAPLTITKLRVHDPASGALLGDVTNGGHVNIVDYPDGITVIAEVSGMPGCVEFVRNGVANVEVSAPFVSGGNTGAQLMADHDLVLGTNDLAVTAYEFADKTGARGPTKAISIALERTFLAPPAIMRAGIIADDNTGFLELVDGMTYARAALPMAADLRIETTPVVVGSVVIGGVGPWVPGLENYLPYTAMGTGRSFMPAPGTYTLQATAYTEGNGMGMAGPPYTVTFSIGP